MLRNLRLPLLGSVSSARFFSSTSNLTRREIRTHSELLVSLLASHPEQVRKKAASSFPVDKVVAAAAARHALIRRGAVALDSASFVESEISKDTDSFKADHAQSTKNFVNHVISSFLFKLQEAVAKNTQEPFYAVFDTVVQDFIRSFKSKSSINGKLLAPELTPENILRSHLLPAIENIGDELKKTRFIEKEPKAIHNHCHLTVKCSGQ